MYSMFATLAVFHEPSGWLNCPASLNMARMVVTLAVSHESTSWLKFVAL